MKTRLAYFLRWIAHKLDPSTFIFFEKAPKANDIIVLVNGVEQTHDEYLVGEQ